NGACPALDSLVLSMMMSAFSGFSRLLPGLKTSVCARLGVTTIRLGVVPAEIGPTVVARTSVSALTILTPPPTGLETKARKAIPLVLAPLDELPPQFTSATLRARKTTGIRTFFKTNGSRLYGSISWMQE